MNLDPATLGGWVVAGITALVALIGNRRKADVDESALVLGKWKELVEQHERTLSSANSQIASLELRLSAAEKRIAELETQRREDTVTIRSLTDENTGLKRAIAQNSQSTAMVLSRAMSSDAALLEQIDHATRPGG